MEWTNAKKFVIVLLVILNLALAGLNYQQKQENTMTALQERAIFEVLSQNGIAMYTDLLTASAPMARFYAEIPEYSKETLERLFFGGEKTTVTMQADRRRYRGAEATLTISGAAGLLEKEDIAGGKEGLTKAEAQKQAEYFLEQTEHFFGNYEEPIVQEEAEGFRVTFYGTYKRENIFSNYFSFFVTQGGIRQIAFYYCPIQGYSGEKKDICFGDEALFTFMRAWRSKENAGEATIHRMELGYTQVAENDAQAAVVYLEPCYRIYLMEEDAPYLVNAYTCQLIERE